MKLITQQGIGRLEELSLNRDRLTNPTFEIGGELYAVPNAVRGDIPAERFGKIYDSINEAEYNIVHSLGEVDRTLYYESVEINRFQKFVIEKILRIQL